MTSIDERARAAAEDLRERAAHRPPHEPREPAAAVARRPLVLGAAAALVLVVAAVALVLAGRDGDVEVVATPAVGVPAGVEPVKWTPGVLGLSLQVPDGWEEGGPRAGFAHSVAAEPMDAYVLATIVSDHADRDLDGFAEARRDQMAEAFDVEVRRSSATVVDGRSAHVWDYRLRLDGQEATVAEYIIDTGGPERLIVAVGELVPVEQDDLRAWIGSTMEIEPGSAAAPDVAHPDPRDAPSGVEPEPWEPPVVGLAMDVPVDWRPGAPFETSLPYAMQAPGEGPRPFVLASRLQARAGNAEARARAREAEGGVREASAKVVVDGRPATVSRWRMPIDAVAAAVQVEYGVELDDGSYAVVTIGYPPTSSGAVADWIRSTFRVTD